MTALKKKETRLQIPPEIAQTYIAQTYIAQMLEELSSMAQTAGLKDLSSLLRATLAASRVDLPLEGES